MAKQALLNPVWYVGSRNLTSQANRVEWDTQIEEKDVTTFGSNGAKEVVGGLMTTTIMGGGPIDYALDADIDLGMWLTRRDLEVHTLGPSNSGGAVAAPA